MENNKSLDGYREGFILNQEIQDVIEKLKKWYFKEWVIMLVGMILIPISILTVGVGLLGYFVPFIWVRKKQKLQRQLEAHALKVNQLEDLQSQIQNQEGLLASIRDTLTKQVEDEISDNQERANRLKNRVAELRDELLKQETQNETAIREQAETLAKLEKQTQTQKRKVEKIKELYRGLEYALNQQVPLSKEEQATLDLICPTVPLHIHSLDVKELRKAFKANEKCIQEVLEKYQSGYTTKTNRTIYQLMVLALTAELQNVLYNLKYTNLDQSEAMILELIQKYRNIVVEGNQSIAPTMNRCISELEYFYLNAIQIEYRYYIAKEQQKNEQAALREQMKQEAEERKQLEAQRKQIEKEESKYLAEIQKAQEQLVQQQAESELARQLEEKIAQLTAQLEAVETQKEEVVKRQNGKAGYVYIISNLGSFGDQVFKVGMTRRLDPMDRVKELGSASVPFTFDVHSFIFSDDAVGLEQQLHQALADHRVNKINHRKEFFRVSLDQLEQLVSEIDPTAEFNRTMLAEEYRQGLAMTQH